MAHNRKLTRKKSKTAVRKTRVFAQQEAKPKPAEMVSKKTLRKTSMSAVGKSRAEGIRLFALAGRPSKEDFIKVYGPNGPKLTWAQRSDAGVPAEKFQAVLAAKQSGRKDAKPSIPALTAKD